MQASPLKQGANTRRRGKALGTDDVELDEDRGDLNAAMSGIQYHKRKSAKVRRIPSIKICRNVVMLKSLASETKDAFKDELRLV